MDAILFDCGGCKRELRAPVSAGGKHGKCPHCGHRNLVPAPQEEEDVEGAVPLTPIDRDEERQMREEIDELMDQERVLRSDDAPEETPARRVPLEQKDEVGAADLHHFVVNYCLDISASNLDRAQTYVHKLEKFGAAGKEAVADFMTGKVLEPALETVPARVLQGFLAQLRDELNKNQSE